MLLILPVPLGAFPVTVPEVTDEDHEYVVPVTPDVSVMSVMAPEQMVFVVGELVTIGNGFTVIT